MSERILNVRVFMPGSYIVTPPGALTDEQCAVVLAAVQTWDLRSEYGELPGMVDTYIEGHATAFGHRWALHMGALPWEDEIKWGGEPWLYIKRVDE